MKIGIEHPDPIVESRYVYSSMFAVLPYFPVLDLCHLIIAFPVPSLLSPSLYLTLSLSPTFTGFSCSSLSSVDPPQVWFDLKFPSEVVEEAKLSSLQLEAVVYSCQQHMNILADGTRAGFLIGKLAWWCMNCLTLLLRY